MIEIPYELIERLFGPFIAHNFNTIMNVLFLTGFVYVFFCRNAIRMSSKQRNKQNQQKKRNQKLSTKWYPTGWVFNEETKLWEPPDYIPEGERPVKPKRTEPTFEEWKASREASQTSNSESVQ